MSEVQEPRPLVAPTDEHREIASSLSGHSAGLIANALAEIEARGHARGAAEAAALREQVRKLAVQYANLSDEVFPSAAADAFHDTALDLRRALDGDS